MSTDEVSAVQLICVQFKSVETSIIRPRNSYLVDVLLLI